MNNINPLQLYIFHRTINADLESLNSGVNGIIVDLESLGKHKRQKGYNTQINEHSINDIRQLKEVPEAHIICRINKIHNKSVMEVENVIQAGADELLLPMVESLDEIKFLIEQVNGRAKVAIMIETEKIIGQLIEVNKLDISRAFIGLQDLHICRGTSSIFESLIDGTVDSIRNLITNYPIGVAGLTIPESGSPLAAKYLSNELCRLKFDFTFLRRSYFLDVKLGQQKSAIKKIYNMLNKSKARTVSETESDHKKFKLLVKKLYSDNGETKLQKQKK